MIGRLHRFGPHPVIGRFVYSPSPAEIAQVETLSDQIRRDRPGIDATEVFGPKRWFIRRASSPTSSVNRARFANGGQ